MKIIVEHRRCRVLFDKKNDVFIKEFYPKSINRIKYFFYFRKYPGTNFEYISKELNKIGVKTPELVSVEKYRIVTRNLRGESLWECIKRDPSIEKKYLDTIVKILNAGIYFGDFHLGNFMVKKGEIYALDLEDYKKEKFFSRSLDEALFRLRKTLKNEKWYKYIESELNTV